MDDFTSFKSLPDSVKYEITVNDGKERIEVECNKREIPDDIFEEAENVYKYLNYCMDFANKILEDKRIKKPCIYNMENLNEDLGNAFMELFNILYENPVHKYIDSKEEI